MNSLENRLSAMLFACVCLCAGVAVAAAQASRTMSTVERHMDTINRQAKDFERDDMARNSAPKKDPETAKRSRQIRVEIEEDLRSLQAAYNDAVVELKTGPRLRPGFAAETGRAVRKHASRLKTNLALPALDGEEEKTGPPPLPDTDRKALTVLCRVIYEFVTNPMFEGTGGLDAKNGAKASLDLDAIIRLAEHLPSVPETASR